EVQRGMPTENHRHRTRGQRWILISLPNKLMVIATIVIAIATAVNLFVAIAMWHEMHATGTDTHELAVSAGKQIDLMRQQLVGTMSAVVTFQEPRITNDPITNKAF